MGNILNDIDTAILFDTLKSRVLRQAILTQDDFGHFIKAGVLADYSECKHEFWESGASFNLPLWFKCKPCGIQFETMPGPTLNFMRTLYSVDGSKWDENRFLKWYRDF